MRLGKVEITNKVVAAPMAGVSNRAFRTLAREMGAGLVVTEMVSDMALRHDHRATFRMLELSPEEHPVAVQLFGNSAGGMAEGAKVVEASGADLIDLNLGCPTAKIVRSGAGAALLRDPPLASEIMSAVVRAVGVPVTVKLRIGWDEDSINITEMTRRAEAAGVVAITIHGRTRMQGYAGRADWEAIRRGREAVGLPVFGNGDVFSALAAKTMLQQTGCAGVAIARGSLGNPWLFRQVAHYLATGQLLPGPTREERVAVALRHLNMLVELKGEYIGVREMRKHGAWYSRGLAGAAALRRRIMAAKSVEEMAAALREMGRGSGGEEREDGPAGDPGNEWHSTPPTGRDG